MYADDALADAEERMMFDEYAAVDDPDDAMFRALVLGDDSDASISEED